MVTSTFGEHWRTKDNQPGLISQLTRTVSLIRKLSTKLTQNILRTVALGLFQSRLMFGLPLVGSVWTPSPYRAKESNPTEPRNLTR